MPILPVLEAFSKDYQITPQEMYEIVGNAVSGMIIAMAVYTAIRIVEHELDLCEKTSEPLHMIRILV